jgi:spermidine synthase
VTEWHDEILHKGIRQRLRIDRLIFSGRTNFQKVDIFDNPDCGRVLVLDNVVQTTERDEHVYHEMLTHVPMIAHGAAKRVLIIGGGDGGLLEEVLKHPVDTVTMVELDPQVVDLCREHLPSICRNAFEDPRTDLVIGDGARYVAETDAAFDVVLVDSPDPVGPATVLFESPFYEGCRRVLNDGGVLATQNGVPFYQSGEMISTHGCLDRLFGHTGFYIAPVPVYIGGHMAFGWATDRQDLSAIPVATIADRVAAVAFDPPLKYYNAGIHSAAFALPNSILNALN